MQAHGENPLKQACNASFEMQKLGAFNNDAINQGEGDNTGC